ncbi:conserved hypothetical membrane protein (DUF368) [Formosa agariphila KMM 3901]|uniref:Conserved hypothetical membrane protein (DUF368) n=1 Tax=Formosa agariphila (strain DSM 15362 / KCTC 12365 / LMG 23005 / KMM 3901 / M-2Alg 35-1) TaxID=1347342 RepID=T2KI55_FORAG|nr:DUF368 domain-containing protein [Formosa agariphila]CDF78480.1 conserved hypothetical membrane protein (DUF368) [Formosa agariphila KMM 3901]
MHRNLKDYLVISLKGMAMGAADAVPGVSGGTIAFISGIYEELISTISGINLSLFKTLKNEGFASFWKQLNGSFLVALLTGIIVSFVSFMRVAKYLLEHHPVLIWSFFFGLIIASIFFVGKQINKWNIATIISLILGAALAFYITTLPSLNSNNSPWFLFFAGAIAICAMILPGISGSFILVILGAYKTLSDAFHDFDFKKIALFAVGALVGLLSFSHLLKWLFKNFHNTTLAVLTGFIFGSLNKVWPWKLTATILEKETGHIIPFSDVSNLGTLAIYEKQTQITEVYKTVTELSTMPAVYAKMNQVDSHVISAIALMIFGFFTIFILEKLGTKKS